MKAKRHLQAILILLAAFLLTSLLFFVANTYDNKYENKQTSPYVLVKDWEFYSGSLYTPKDFEENTKKPFESIYIGQFGNFAEGDRSESPFGVATYRKVLYLEDNPSGWVLELPEIYSMSNVYVNGKLVRAYGALSQETYQMHVQNTLLPLPSGSVELVIQVANYSHYYSGMTFPPILGSSQEITTIVIQRLLFYGVLCFFTLGTSLILLLLWGQKRKKQLYIGYSLLCLFFSIRMLYPFLHWLGINAGEFFYVIEDTSYFAMVACMVFLTYQLCNGVIPKKLQTIVFVTTIGFMFLPFVATYLIFPYQPQSILYYGQLIMVFKIVIALYLMMVSFMSSYKGKAYLWLLAGNAVFGFGIFIDFFTAGKFEPIRFGWQDEYTSFMIVLLFTVLMMQQHYHIAKENERLNDHLQEEVEQKTSTLEKMLAERRRFLSSAAHDLKAPASIIQTYIDFIQESDIEIDHELKTYLNVIHRKTSQMVDNVQQLQTYNVQEGIQENHEHINSNEFLRYVYEETKPYADANGIYYELHLPKKSSALLLQKTKVFRALENIILNAVEHTQMEGCITLDVINCDEIIKIVIQDSGEGIAPEILPRIFEHRFRVSGGNEERGLGLYFAKVTIEENRGRIEVASKLGQSTTFTICFPTLN